MQPFAFLVAKGQEWHGSIGLSNGSFKLLGEQPFHHLNRSRLQGFVVLTTWLTFVGHEVEIRTAFVTATKHSQRLALELAPRHFGGGGKLGNVG